MPVTMRDRWTDERLDDLNARVDSGFRRMDEKFDKVDQRLDKIDARFERLDERLERLDARMTTRIDSVLYSLIGLGALMVAGFTAIATKL